MEKIKKAEFSFNKYIIKDAKIHISKKNMGNAIQVTFNPKGVLDKDAKVFILNLDASINDDANSFNIEISAEAEFKFEAENMDMRFLLHNAPAILFPYIRAYIANLSVLSGIQTILLPTLNMSGLSKDLKDNIQIKDNTKESF